MPGKEVEKVPWRQMGREDMSEKTLAVCLR